MPLKSLVVIALRLFAIYLLVENLAELFIYLPTMISMVVEAVQLSPGAGSPSLFSVMLAPIGMLAVTVIFWFLASRLSSAITKGHDTQLTFTSLTREDLYRFAFVFLGLYFVLSSIYSILQTVYQFFAFDFPQPSDNPQKGRYLWPFLGHLFTLIAGFVCFFGAGNWTNKLISLESKTQVPPNP